MLKIPILVAKNQKVFYGFDDIQQFDCCIIHQKTKYINNRPDWFYTKEKQKFEIKNELVTTLPVLVFAYHSNQFDNGGVPSDILEISDFSHKNELILAKGAYTIIIKDKDFKIINKFEHIIK